MLSLIDTQSIAHRHIYTERVQTSRKNTKNAGDTHNAVALETLNDRRKSGEYRDAAYTAALDADNATEARPSARYTAVDVVRAISSPSLHQAAISKR